jgi:hypothetical protein
MTMLMIVVLTLSALIGLASVIRVALRGRRRRDLVDEAHGDWWPRFEQAFREYERRSSERAPGTD